MGLSTNTEFGINLITHNQNKWGIIARLRRAWCQSQQICKILISCPKSKNSAVKAIAKFFASCCYTGYFPIAPGTVGSFVALFLYLVIPGNTWYILTAVAIGLFFFGACCAAIAEKEWGHDAGRITIDEAIGMLISLIAVPKTILWAGIAFLAFRFFDIIKLFPARQAENLRGGWGIMTDDLVAGIYANILTHILYALSPALIRTTKVIFSWLLS